MSFVLPDTGQVVEYRSGDDSNYGLDVTDYNDDDGHAGLSYTKLDALGDDLPNEAISWEFVRDNRTGLTWKFLSTPGGTWDQDVAAAATYGALGKTWRLPTIKELVYLGSYNRTDVVFDDMLGYVDAGFTVRSSTENASDTDKVWGLNENNGYTDYFINKSSTGHTVFYVTGDEVECSLTDNGDGTITDSSTGLMWSKYLLGGDGISPPDTKDWNDAVDGTISLSLGGHEDWRLPNLKELQSIIDYSTVDPLDTTFFSQIPPNSKLWSATTLSTSASQAWAFYLYLYGFQYAVSKTSSTDNYALAVRGLGEVAPVEFWHNHTLQRELLSKTPKRLEKKPTVTVIPGNPGQPYIPPTPPTPEKTSTHTSINYICKRVI